MRGVLSGLLRRVVWIAYFVVALAIGVSPDLMGQRVEQLAAPYAWSAVGWEARHLRDGAQEIADQVGGRWTDADALSLVKSYLDGTVGDVDPAVLRSGLAAAVALELRDHGAATVGPVVRPPVTLSMAQPLRLLVVSPRNEIRQADWALLDETFPPSLASTLESDVESLNVSALVVDQIAIATYPTLIPSGTPPSSALQTIAHEWTHTALFFTPLGRAYGSSSEARAINETTADVVGGEIGDALLRRVGASSKPVVSSGGSDFADRMRAIRREVDRLLANGEVDGAEQYMEEERQGLVADGYRIRRLNQAYFAFFGNYAEGPAASTEVPDAVRAIRSTSSTLGDFLSRVGEVTSVDELRAESGRASQ